MKNISKKKLWATITVLCLSCLAGCGNHPRLHSGEIPRDSEAQEEIAEIANPEAPPETDSPAEPADNAAEPAFSLIDASGMTLQTRILPPKGYSRTAADEGSLAEFLRDYPLREDKSPVLLYDGRKKGNQSAHQAVFALPVEAEDLQQCADSVMRIYAEYYYQSGQPEKIAFHFTSGFLAEYARWRDGERIAVNGNQVEWIPGSAFDDSYETFVKYLRIVFCYAGTLSMEAESEQTELSHARVGDVFLKGGSPGHVVMIVDVCENEAGQRAFLLGQGYMPAQEFHVLKNPLHEEDCWYYEEEITYPFQTPEYVFMEGSLRRLSY